MSICAIICEFNPFHNGHKYVIEKAKELSGCDSVICIMSANFTQRGDVCILNKFKRATHAVLAGADAVLELPAPFSVAPAEIFAKGAVKILSSIPDFTTLAFGCETDDENLFLTSAKILLDECETFSKSLNDELSTGESFIKSYVKAFEKCGGKKNFLSSPNNILGVEYVKALLLCNKKIKALPIKRVGSDFNDDYLTEEFSSASAIRKSLSSPKIKNNVPEFVYNDLSTEVPTIKFEEFCTLAINIANKNDLSRIFGCTEGLENKLKNEVLNGYKNIIQSATAKRYSSSRIKRILCANLLKLYKNDTLDFLQNDLYIKPLALKKECAESVLQTLSKSTFPTVILQKHKNLLNETAKKCFNICEYADSVWDLIFSTKTYNYTVLKV